MGIIFKRWLLSTFWSIFFQSLFLCLFLVFGFYIVVLHCHTQTHLYYPFSCLCKARVYWKYMEVWPNRPRRFPRNFPGNQNKWLYKQKRNNLWLVLDFFSFSFGWSCLCESLWIVAFQRWIVQAWTGGQGPQFQSYMV